MVEQQKTDQKIEKKDFLFSKIEHNIHKCYFMDAKNKD